MCNTCVIILNKLKYKNSKKVNILIFNSQKINYFLYDLNCAR